MLQNFYLKIGTILLFFILLFAFFKVVGPISLSINSVSTNKTDVFTVSGEGKVEAKPDIANVSVGVEATAPTVKQAQDGINGNIDKISQSIKGLGVSDQDIQSTTYNIYPNFNSDQRQITGFTASTTLEIKVRDLAKVNQVIDLAVANGATNISEVSFDIENKSQLENQAREKAVAQAKEKAVQAAQVAGFKLGRIINYTETSSPGIPPILGGGLMSADSGTTKTQIQTGSSQIQITATLSYEII